MNSELLFNRLFGVGNYSITIDGFFLHGIANLGDKEFKIIGTCKSVAIDSKLALRISEKILETIFEDKDKAVKRSIIFLVDTQGHKLSRFEEYIGINGYFAHMAKCIFLAGLCEHKTLSIVHGEAVSGCFLAFAMMADRVCALEDAKIYVMDLRAMSKITKIDYEKLLELSKTSPIFAPGVYNYWLMGGVHEIWFNKDNWQEKLLKAVDYVSKIDNRYELGAIRQGRIKAKEVISVIKSHCKGINV